MQFLSVAVNGPALLVILDCKISVPEHKLPNERQKWRQVNEQTKKDKTKIKISKLICTVITKLIWK